LRYGSWVKQTSLIGVNGADQGDSFMILAINSMFAAWAIRTKNKTPQVRAGTYFDDTGLRAEEIHYAQLVEACAETLKFDQLTGQKTHDLKTKHSSTTQSGRKLLCSELPQWENVTEETLLGYQLQFIRKSKFTKQDERWDKVLQVFEFLQHSYEPRHKREMLVYGKIYPQFLFGSEHTGIKRALEAPLTSQVMRLIWGDHRKYRAKEVVFGILRRGHLLDPMVVSDYKTCIMVRNILQKKSLFGPSGLNFGKVITRVPHSNLGVWRHVLAKLLISVPGSGKRLSSLDVRI
jgi:hypothetical protein